MYILTNFSLIFLINWTDGATFTSGAGSMEFKSRDDKISHMLPMTRHHCNLHCIGSGAKPRRWASLTCDTL